MRIYICTHIYISLGHLRLHLKHVVDCVFHFDQVLLTYQYLCSISVLVPRVGKLGSRLSDHKVQRSLISTGSRASEIRVAISALLGHALANHNVAEGNMYETIIT